MHLARVRKRSTTVMNLLSSCDRPVSGFYERFNKVRGVKCRGVSPGSDQRLVRFAVDANQRSGLPW
jgi:hypothetical protein